MTMSIRDGCPATTGFTPGPAADGGQTRTLDPPTVYAAVVHAPDGVRFLEVCASRAALTARLVDYVRRCAGERLWPDDAAHIERLVAVGMWDAAVDEYFACVSARWDEECLYRASTVLAPECPLREGEDVAARR